MHLTLNITFTIEQAAVVERGCDRDFAKLTAEDFARVCKELNELRVQVYGAMWCEEMLTALEREGE